MSDNPSSDILIRCLRSGVFPGYSLPLFSFFPPPFSSTQHCLLSIPTYVTLILAQICSVTVDLLPKMSLCITYSISIKSPKSI